MKTLIQAAVVTLSAASAASPRMGGKRSKGYYGVEVLTGANFPA